ncbi:MAG TPA: polysaccharide pyruvyl transferase family protein, partial [Iamia sp.]|nr:polysaccharide pyruvyl transferase family protein [Iamia sp.]
SGAAGLDPLESGPDRLRNVQEMTSIDAVRVALVFDTTSLAGNWGCRATSIALADLVTESGALLDSAIPALDIEVGPVTRRLGRVARAARGAGRGAPPSSQLVTASTDRSGSSLAGSGGRFVALGRLAERADRRKLPTPDGAADLEGCVDAMLASDFLRPHLDRLAAADVVVVNGEGTVYGGQAKGRRLLALTHLAKHRLGRRVAYVNQTLDLADERDREVADAVLPGLDDVSFREPLSAEAWGRAVPGGGAAFVPDAAFRLEPIDDDAFWPGARRSDTYSVWPDRVPGLRPGYVCVGGSSSLLRPGATADPTAGYRRLCRRLLDAGHPVLLTSSDPVDEQFLRPLARELGLGHLGCATPVPQAVDVLAHAGAVITGRWHPSIFASLGGTPVVSLGANSFKTEGFQRLIGTKVPVEPADLGGGAVEAVLGHLEDLVDRGDALRAEIAARARELREQTPGLVRVLDAPS